MLSESGWKGPGIWPPSAAPEGKAPDAEVAGASERLASALKSGLPIWTSGTRPFTRSEDNGSWMVYPPRNPKPHFLNETAAFILERCDGTHGIDELVGALMDQFEGAPRSTLEADVVRCLSFLKTLGLIHWSRAEEETLARRPEPRFHTAGENDFTRISAFLAEQKGLLHAVPGLNGLHLVTGPPSRKWHDDATLRVRQTNNLELYFVLEHDRRMVGAAGVHLTSLNAGNLGFSLLVARAGGDHLALTSELMQSVFEFCSARKVMRLKFPILPQFQNDEVRGFLRERGYNKELSLLDELGRDQDIELWSRVAGFDSTRGS